MEPTLHRYDIVLINKAEKDITRSGLYLIWVGKNLKIRRLSQQLTGDILISCDNSKYPSITLSSKDHKQLKVVGRALGRLEHLGL
jgi:phage repressor protein C with HTH and peptisase S24 domain